MIAKLLRSRLFIHVCWLLLLAIVFPQLELTAVAAILDASQVMELKGMGWSDSGLVALQDLLRVTSYYGYADIRSMTTSGRGEASILTEIRGRVETERQETLRRQQEAERERQEEQARRGRIEARKATARLIALGVAVLLIVAISVALTPAKK